MPILEQIDLSEFFETPTETVERVLVIIGTNKSVAYSKTGSKTGASGWVQFMPKTYRNVRNLYPSSGLIKDFKEGTADHVNSMMAAILLYDYNLANLIKYYGNKILEDRRLEEYLAGAYNGGINRVNISLKASISRGLNDWTGKLLSETKGFMFKLRFLRENNLP